MRTAKWILWIVAPALALIVLAGCGGGGNDQAKTDLMKTLNPGESDSGPRPTSAPLPATWTPAPTLTQAPRPTYEITHRPTATWFVVGTRVPQTTPGIIEPGSAAQGSAAQIKQITQAGSIQLDNVLDMAWVPDGSALAVASVNGVILYPGGDLNAVAQDLPVTQGELGQQPECVAFSPDGKLAATGNSEGAIKLWDVAGQVIQREWDAGDIMIQDCGFTSDGALLITTGSSNRIDVWNPATGESVHTLQSTSPDVYCLAVYPLDAPIVVTGGSNPVPQVWDVAKGEQLAAPQGHANQVIDVAFSPDGASFATGDGAGVVRLWTVAGAQKDEPLMTLQGVGSQIESLAYSPDSRLIAAGFQDGSLKIWDVNSQQSIFETHAHAAVTGSLVWSPDGTRLYSSGLDGTLIMWAVQRGQ